MQGGGGRKIRSVTQTHYLKFHLEQSLTHSQHLCGPFATLRAPDIPSDASLPEGKTPSLSDPQNFHPRNSPVRRPQSLFFNSYSSFPTLLVLPPFLSWI